MVEAIALDTHRFVTRLTESGFTEKQTETLAEEHVARPNANLATKTDVEALWQESPRAPRKASRSAIPRRGTTRLRRVMNPCIGVASVLNREVRAGSPDPHPPGCDKHCDKHFLK
ncbi:MAG: hypothetical protein OXU75_12405 [Deltaproteobacteria bacterium]|nr:hypothetical protein [Deltaproteobacteria bacterium]